MTHNSFFAITLVVTSFFTGAIGGTPGLGLPEWFPQCFEDDSSPLVIVECIKGNLDVECFDDETIQDEILPCIREELLLCNTVARSWSDRGIGRDKTVDGSMLLAIKNATQVCLSSHVDCIQSNVQEFVTELEPCVNQTVSALGACAVANKDICGTSCDGALKSLQGMYEDINPVALSTCIGIQSEIMDSSCEIMSCCEPCVDEYEALMNCVVNDVLAYTRKPCDLTCDTGRRGLRGVRGWFDDSVSGDGSVVGDIAACMEVAPGLTGGDGSELASRFHVFLECLVGKSMEEAD